MIAETNVATDAMKNSDWIALALGLTAFVAAIWSNIIAFRALKSTGKQRVAEYRKDWIEKLRMQVAEFDALTNVRMVNSRANIEIGKLAKNSINEEVMLTNIKESNSAHQRCSAIKSYVHLLLNPNEQGHEKLVNAMGEILSTATPTNEKVVELRKITQTVLKTEWDRLKSELN